MDAHAESIWNRTKSREKTLTEAYWRFDRDFSRNHMGAHIALASTYYSLVKRNLGLKPGVVLAFWDMRQAVVHVNRAVEFAEHLENLSVDELDVVSRIWLKVPWWLGGDIERAEKAILNALDLNHREAVTMKPHTRANLDISLGEIYFKSHGLSVAEYYHDQARQLIPKIREEESADREQQLVRVLTAVGFFYNDHGDPREQVEAGNFLREAYALAQLVACDQIDKIEKGCRRRGIDLH